MAFKPVAIAERGESVKFEKEGDSITGYFLGSEQFEYNGDMLTSHKFRTKTGSILSTLGKASLDRQLANVTPGVMTRVTYKGTQKLKAGKTLKVFLVETDADDVSAGAPAAKVSNGAAQISAKQIG